MHRVLWVSAVVAQKDSGENEVMYYMTRYRYMENVFFTSNTNIYRLDLQLRQFTFFCMLKVICVEIRFRFEHFHILNGGKKH